jgi:hypothetical protein
MAMGYVEAEAQSNRDDEAMYAKYGGYGGGVTRPEKWTAFNRRCSR